jgi:hypothetical protein
MQTGRSKNPAFMAEIPHIGAVISREKGAGGLIPPFLSFNQTMQGATFLGGLYQAMMPPAARTGVPTLTHPFFGTAAQSQERFERLASSFCRIWMSRCGAHRITTRWRLMGVITPGRVR